MLLRRNHPVRLLLTLFAALLILAPSAPAVSAQGTTPAAPEEAFVSLQQSLDRALRQGQPGLAVEDEEYWSSSLPVTPPVRTYPVDNSHGAYGNKPRWPGQRDIDNGIAALGQAPLNPGKPGTAGGAGQTQSGGALPGASQVDPTVLAAALRQSDQAERYALSVLNNVNGGNWNQFLGRPAAATTWGVSFNNALSLGVGTAVPAPTAANVLGFSAPQPTIYAPPLIRRLNYLLYAPWSGATIDPRTTLDARYQQLEQQQQNRLFTDPDLSGMRAEANKVLLYYIYTDPYYMFWSFEYTTVLNRIRETRPAFADLRQLAETIRGWQATDDEAALRERYVARLQFQVLAAQVEAETLVFLAANPALARDLSAVQLWLNQRLLLVLSQPAVSLWYANWLQRWNTFAFTSEAARAEQRQVQAVLNEYPAFAEYTKLNSEVVQLLPSYGGFEASQRAAALGGAVQTSPAVATVIQSAYNNYRTRISEIVREGQLAAALERYYAAVNDLARNDPAYRDLSTVQIRAADELAAYQRQLHAVMLLGYRTNGPLYNAYLDPTVLALLTSSTTREMSLRAGDFYEAYNRYWYGLFTSQGYRELESRTRGEVLNALETIEPQLIGARTTFMTTVNSIPLVAQLRRAQNELVALMRGEAQLNSLPIGDPTPELNSRLDRMAELAEELNRLPPPAIASGQWHTFLPLVRSE